MALPSKIDNQNVLGALVDRLRPGAAYRRYDNYAELTATWEDQSQVLPTEQELIDEYVLLQSDQTAQLAIDIVKADAQTQASNIPNWATWNEVTALAWFDANVTSTADALPVMRAMIRLLIALRNEAWPKLQE